MKFSINKNELLNAYSIVSKGVSNRSTIPVLSGILIEAAEDTIILRSTDLELSIQYEVAALVEQQGKGVVPNKLFGDIIKSLPDVAVYIEINEEEANISCDASHFAIRALSSDEFPEFPHVEVSQKVEIPFNEFSSMVRRVSRAVSRDESRPNLTGINIEVGEGNLRMVATDSYRLAVTNSPLDSQVEDFAAVISGTFMSEIAALPKSNDNILLALSENQIVVEYQSTVFINRRIEGKYPNYKQLMTGTYNLRMEVPTAEFTQAAKRASLMGSSGSPMKILADADGGFIKVMAATQDVGNSSEVINCSGEGEAKEIAFNCGYIIDGLGGVDSDTVSFEVEATGRFGVLRATGNEDYWYLIMPVRA